KFLSSSPLCPATQSGLCELRRYLDSSRSTRIFALWRKQVKPWGRVSFRCPNSPELLEIGPEVCNVLVVLDADKCHAGARHFLHRRADIFGESFLAPAARLDGELPAQDAC